jgi:hypothetical protein
LLEHILYQKMVASNVVTADDSTIVVFFKPFLLEKLSFEQKLLDPTMRQKGINADLIWINLFSKLKPVNPFAQCAVFLRIHKITLRGIDSGDFSAEMSANLPLIMPSLLTLATLSDLAQTASEKYH